MEPTRDAAATTTIRRWARLRVSAAARRAAVAVAGGLPPSLLALQDLGATLMIMTETMTIGTLARQADVNPRTLRYYERIGLLVPSASTDAGYRLYTARDAARLAFIRRAQALGLTLTEIADVIAVREAGTAPCRHVRALAQAKVAALNERIAELLALREELTRLAERAEAFEAECVEGSSICLAVERAQPATP